MAECWKDQVGTYADQQVGTFGYTSGTGSGVLSVPVSSEKDITGIHITAKQPTTFNIDGGATVYLERGQVLPWNIKGNLQGVTINFLSGSYNYIIDWTVD